MSAHFLRVDLNRAGAQFRPVTIAPGVPLLDRPGGLTHYTIARKWLGELIAEPRWGSRGVAYFIRAQDNQRLVDVRCVPLNERDARRKIFQAEMEKLRGLLAKVKPEPDEASLLTALRQAFEELRAGPQRNRQGDSLFKYRDPQGKLRLVWAWGYARKDLCPGAPQICPKCAGLFVRPAEKPLICALCGWRPAAHRWAKKALAAIALVAIALGLGSWWPNRTPAGPSAMPSTAQAGEQLAQVADATTDPDQPPSATQSETSLANKSLASPLPKGTKNDPSLASASGLEKLDPAIATKSGTGSAAGNTHDPPAVNPKRLPAALAGGADKPTAGGPAKAAGSPSRGPTASTPLASAGHTPMAGGGSGHGLGLGGMGGSGFGGSGAGLGGGGLGGGGSGRGGLGSGSSNGGAAHPAMAGSLAGHSGLGAVAANAAAVRPPLRAAAGTSGGAFPGATGRPALWHRAGAPGSSSYRGGYSGAGTRGGHWPVGGGGVRAGVDGLGLWDGFWDPGAHYAGWAHDGFVTGAPAIVSGPGAVIRHAPVSGVTTVAPRTVVADVPRPTVVDSLNIAPPVDVSIATVPAITSSIGSWFQNVQALNAAQTDTGVELELEVQGENQVGGLEYRLVTPGDASDLDWYPARQNGTQTRVVLLSPKLVGPPADGTYRLMIEARNTVTQERAQFPYAFRLVLGVHPETTGNSKH